MVADDLIWTELVLDPPTFDIISAECYKQHLIERDLDYSYIKNISVNAEYFLNLNPWEKRPFGGYVGKFRRDYDKTFAETYTDVLIAGTPDYNSPEIAGIKKDLNLVELCCIKQTQLPGNIVGEHVDMNIGLCNILTNKGIADKVKVKHIRKYIVYLDDWSHGQVFMCGRHAFTNWKKGDVMSFPWYMPHSTANTGLKPRPILFIAGVEL